MNQEKYRISFTLKPKEPITAFALVIGGFHPLFYIPAQILLLDRNIVSNASNIIRNGAHKDNQHNAWWYSFINSPNYTLNPMLSALEGSRQRIPTFEEFRLEFDKAKATLKEFFPGARLAEYSEEHYRGAYSLVLEVADCYLSEIEFLKIVSPMLTNRGSVRELQDIEEHVMNLARSCGLPRLTFSLLACLSCVYESSSESSAGRLIIKPKPTYTDEMAHNALMDLYALAILIQGNARLNSQTALCTCDKGLVEFWCALKVKPGYKLTAEGFNFNMEITKELFPRLSPEGLLSLKRRIEMYKFQ